MCWVDLGVGPRSFRHHCKCFFFHVRTWRLLQKPVKTMQIARVGKMLADEYGTATNIKSRVNKLSVLSAIISTQQRLK